MSEDLRSPAAGWHRGDRLPLDKALERSGLPREQAGQIVTDLISGGWLIVADYYVPTSDELFGQYGTLGAAYLRNRINVRWVMCAETHDALASRYSRTKFAAQPEMATFSSALVDPSPEMLEFTVRTVMENRRYWGDPSTLFGIPIRIDPVARRPVFEIMPREETPE